MPAALFFRPTYTQEEIKIFGYDWDSTQVNNWLLENKIHKKIIDSFMNLDGSCLKQLYDLTKENPQFVYQTLINESNNELKLLDIIYFVTRLNRLYNY